MSDSVRPHGLQPIRLLRPWDFPGKSTGVGCHCLLQYSSLEISKWTLLLLPTIPGNYGDSGLTLGSGWINYAETLHFQSFLNRTVNKESRIYIFKCYHRGSSNSPKRHMTDLQLSPQPWHDPTRAGLSVECHSSFGLDKLCIAVGCLSAALVTTRCHQHFPSHNNQNCLQTLPNLPAGGDRG